MARARTKRREPSVAAGRTPLPASAAAVLDSVDASTVAALRKLGGGKHADLYPKLVELFRTSSTQSLESSTPRFEGDDLPAAAAVCHKLASAAANVGALAFAHGVKELERHALAGERERARELA